MSRRGKQPVITDWHLWDDVKRTVDPLRATATGGPHGPAQKTAEPVAEPQPLPVPVPAQTRPAFVIPTDWTIGSAVGVPQGKPAYGGKRPPRIEDRPIEPKLKRKVMRGQIEIDGTIDLHGMRQDEARSALSRFLIARAARGDRTVLVITGKGLKKIDATTVIERGVLRQMLPIWLADPNLSPLVAGWGVSAQSHGGEGAYYIRIRRVAS